jgi:hypothetical protein
MPVALTVSGMRVRPTGWLLSVEEHSGCCLRPLVRVSGQGQAAAVRNSRGDRCGGATGGGALTSGDLPYFS